MLAEAHEASKLCFFRVVLGNVARNLCFALGKKGFFEVELQLLLEYLSGYLSSTPGSQLLVSRFLGV
jgi:hypothetical protein